MYNNRRLALSIAYLLIGISLLVLSIKGILGPSIYSGFAGGLIAVGSLLTYKNLKYKNNSEYREKIDIAENDERNRYIRMKSWSWTGYLLVIIYGVGTIVSLVNGNESLQMYFANSECLIIFIYLIAYIVISKKD